jgi:hypothetical protein
MRTHRKKHNSNNAINTERQTRINEIISKNKITYIQKDGKTERNNNK